jgi:hypothetical protein
MTIENEQELFASQGTVVVRKGVSDELSQVGSG